MAQGRHGIYYVSHTTMENMGWYLFPYLPTSYGLNNQQRRSWECHVITERILSKYIVLVNGMVMGIHRQNPLMSTYNYSSTSPLKTPTYPEGNYRKILKPFNLRIRYGDLNLNPIQIPQRWDL